MVIGVGNPSRRDDGVGWVVAAAAGRRLGETVDIRLCDGDPARLLDAWTDVELAVVVDAMRSGAAARRDPRRRGGRGHRAPTVARSRR